MLVLRNFLDHVWFLVILLVALQPAAGLLFVLLSVFVTDMHAILISEAVVLIVAVVVAIFSSLTVGLINEISREQMVSEGC